MKRKIFTAIIVLALIIVIMFGLCLYMGYSFFCSGPEEIKEGFSTELVDGLKSRYGITIPDGADFIKGYNVIFRDSSVVVLFEYPLSSQIEENDLGEYVFDLLKLDEEMWPRGAVTDVSHYGDSFEATGGRSFDWMIKHKSEPYTEIEFSQKDGKLLIRIVGYHPHTTFP